MTSLSSLGEVAVLSNAWKTTQRVKENEKKTGIYCKQKKMIQKYADINEMEISD